MDKPHDQDASQEGPGLAGPDYFSLVIEWEQPDDETAAAQQRDDTSGFADQEVRHWDAVEEASD